MRILLINYEYPPVGAGAANATWHMARALRAIGHETTVLTANFGELTGWTEEDSVHVYRCPAIRARQDRSNILEMLTFVIGASTALGRVVTKRGIEAAIAFFSIPCGPLGLLANWRFGIPYVVSLRGGDVPGTEPRLKNFYRVLRPIRRLVLRRSTRVVANSLGLRNLSEAADPYPVAVIFNGVDSAYFCPQPPTPSPELRLLFVGRFQPQKNLFFLLDALKRLREDRHVRASLDLVGDGPEAAALREHCARIGLESAVRWHGWVDRSALREAYRQADCLVNPSHYEGMPNVVLEGMACGLPIVASNVAGNDAVVVPGVTGLLFTPGDGSGLVASLEQIARDRDAARRMGQAARARAVEDFSWSGVAQKYATLLAGTDPDAAAAASTAQPR